MIPAIVFSKDRACQLDTLLSSLETNAPGVFDIDVLWKASTDDFLRGYRKGRHDGVAYSYEDDFQEQVFDLLPMDGPVCFFVDDGILYRWVPTIPDLDDRWIAFSLRLGRNTDTCYPHGGVAQAKPDWVEVGLGLLAWDWSLGPYDYGYPFSLDGHIMRAEDVRTLAGEFTNPNELEQNLASRAGALMERSPLLASFPSSRLVSVPANAVSVTHRNRVMDAPAYTAEKLNDMFLDGWRIDWRAIDYSGVNAAHCELEYVFAKDLR